MISLINHTKHSLRLVQFANLRMSSSSASSNEIVFEKVNNVGTILLNRPKQLNALNLTMVKEMHKSLDAIEKDNDIKAVVVKGAGEVAFCAGGDVKTVRQDCLDNKEDLSLEFFREEYQLNYRIANFKKPYISLLNGVTMGGGVGLSVHGKYRIATEKTLFAMPETAIGFFADVGGSYFLPRLANHTGLFLALTGNRVKGEDNKRVGIATHFVSQNNLSNLENELSSANDLDNGKVAAILNGFDQTVEGEYDTTMISKIFSASTLEEMYARLEKENTDWSKQQLKLLNKMSPTALKVAIRQLKEGSEMDLKKCLEMEYMLTQRFMNDSDFFEGVRAVLVDRGSKPSWKPANYSEVTSDRVDWFFTQQASDKHMSADAKL